MLIWLSVSTISTISTVMTLREQINWIYPPYPPIHAPAELMVFVKSTKSTFSAGLVLVTTAL
jgi:hypothetical protein